ncbi:MAG: DNA mismatch repair protein MutS, partial [Flavobacteriia bacterium]|nr:DNA mismatch repair protein MutS [Candidatus Bostrichicola ureolyticus]
TGINNIKIYYNNILGYFFEIRNSSKNKVPSNWIRKQTLVGAERYVNEELKNYEVQILCSAKKIIILEIQLFKKLIQFISNYIKYLQENAKLIALLDVLHSFSICAKENNYNKPILDKSFDICIKEGRHPVIEKQIPIGDSYIPNNILLNTKDQQIIIITGPNMSGKSAILRQTAIIVLMAHIGSYVPAKYAKIGLIDRIFSRVGASDNISMGESTFMVEMTETAGILNNISNRSLIILDEIGRGTSTYDGISIAWAIIEYLHKHIKRPKTLFATHYHELNKMMLLFDRIKNYNVSIKEINGNIIFLRKLIPGGSTHSFGINVAKLAGMPSEIIKRSIEILKYIENKNKKFYNN